MQDTKIQVAVIADEEASYAGSVHELSSLGAVAQFQAATCPPMEAGCAVQLVFSSPSCSRVLPVDARVLGSREKPPMRFCSFSFLEDSPQLSDLVRSVVPQERRRARRVAPTPQGSGVKLVVPRSIIPLLPEIPEMAEVREDGVAVTGAALNVSHWGLAAQIEPRAELAFVASDRIVAELHLDALDQTISVEGKILHRQEQDGAYLYGIEFQWKATEDAAAKQRALTIALIRWKHCE